ncbi:Ectopic P granules protein 5 [Nowakowskiella sp. JEL0407]|nr:Ectopic P granules protein 5 [Nowakowskiella sp. JEL0407]
MELQKPREKQKLKKEKIVSSVRDNNSTKSFSPTITSHQQSISPSNESTINRLNDLITNISHLKNDDVTKKLTTETAELINTTQYPSVQIADNNLQQIQQNLEWNDVIYDEALHHEFNPNYQPDSSLYPLDYDTVYDNTLRIDKDFEFNTVREYEVIDAPSAPPQLDFDDMNDFVFEEPIESLEDIVESVENSTTLTFDNPLLINHPAAVSEFLSRNGSPPLPDDIFYIHLSQYESAAQKILNNKLELSQNHTTIQSVVAELWTLKKNLKTLESTCADGVKVKIQATVEEAVFDQVQSEEISRLLAELRQKIYYNYCKDLFLSKVEKTWIMSYIDECLQKAEEENDLTCIHELIDILFYFEFRQLPDSLQFKRDVRSWIFHICTYIINFGDLLDHRKLFLHFIRHPKFTEWGVGLIHFAKPTNLIHIQHYIVSLRILIGSVEEVYEKVENELKNEEIRSIKMVETEGKEWNVISRDEVPDDPIFGGTPKREFPRFVLDQDEFLKIWDQCNIKVTVEEIMKVVTEEELIAVIYSVLKILKSSLDTFDVVGYEILRGRIANALIWCCSKLVEYSSSSQTFRSSVESIIVVVNRWLLGSNSDSWIWLQDLAVIIHSINHNWDSASRIRWLCIGELYGIRKNVRQELLSRFGVGLTNASLSKLIDHATPEEISALIDYCQQLTVNPLGGRNRNTENDPNLALISCHFIYDTSFLKWIERMRISALKKGKKLIQIDQSTLLGWNKVHENGIKALTSLCKCFPHLISALLSWVRSNLKSASISIDSSPDTASFTWSPVTLELISTSYMELFNSLPIYNWQPDLSDLDILHNMLKDPIGSVKFKLAKLVLSNLNWGEVQSSNPGEKGRYSLFLPRSHHRAVAIAVSNIYLDKQPQTNESSTAVVTPRNAANAVGKGIEYATDVAVSTTKKLGVDRVVGEYGVSVMMTTGLAAQNAVALVGAYSPNLEIPVPNIRIGWSSAEEIEFAEWCWKLILSLSIYQSPSSKNTYHLAPNDASLRPFLPLEAPLLSTLRGAVNDDPLAAYVLIMVTELGHNPRIFDSKTWPLLNSLLAGLAQKKPALKVMTEIFPSMIDETSEDEWFSSKNWKVFCGRLHGKVDVDTMNPTSDCNLYKILGECVRDYCGESLASSQSLPILKTVKTVVKCWIRFALFDETGGFLILPLSTLRTLDAICDAANNVGGQFKSIVFEELLNSYQSILNRWETQQQESKTKTSIAKYAYDSVWSTYSPSLVSMRIGGMVSSASAAIGATSPILASAVVPWFIYEALLVEIKLEEDLRRMLAESKLKRISHDDAKMKGIALSSTKFAKVISFCLDLPPGHSLTLRAWQVINLKSLCECKVLPLVKLFFSLYLERPASVSAYHDVPGLGYQLLAENDALGKKLIEKLNTLIERTHGVSIPDLDMVVLYKSMILWLEDKKLGKSPSAFVSQHLPEKYSHSYLQQCTNGDILLYSNESNAWPLCNVVKEKERHLAMIAGSAGKSASQASTPETRKSKSNSFSLGGPSTSLPAYVSRQPLAILHHSDAQKRWNSITANIAFLNKRAQQFNSIVAQHARCDEEYISALPKLYVNEKKKARMEKNCSGGVLAADGTILRKCRGAAVFDFRTNDVKMVSEVKSILENTRTQVEEFSDADRIDASTCVAVVRLAKEIENYGERDGDEDEKDAIRLFYELSNLDLRLISEYPPLGWIVKEAIQILGKTIVVMNENECQRYFSLLLQHATQVNKESDSLMFEYVNLYISIFNPLSAPTQFIDMYEQVSKIGHRLTPHVSELIFEKFDTASWSELSTADQRFELVSAMMIHYPDSQSPLSPLIQNLFQNTIRSNFNALSDKTLDLLLTQLVDDDKHKREVSQIFLRNFVDLLHPQLSQSRTNIGLAALIEESQPKNGSLNKSKLCAVLFRLRDFLAVVSGKFPNIYKLNEGVPGILLDMVAYVSLSAQLYIPVSEQRFEELWSQLRELFLLWFGIIFSAKHVLTGVWENEMESQLIEDCEIFVRLILKLTSGFAIPGRAHLSFWNMYKVVLEATNCEGGKVLRKVFQRVVLKTKIWEFFVFNQSIAGQVLTYWESKLADLGTLRFVWETLDISEWDIFDLQSRSIVSKEFLKISFLLISTSDEILNVSRNEWIPMNDTINNDERMRLYRKLFQKFREVDWSQQPLECFTYAISLLPSSWRSTSVSLGEVLLGDIEIEPEGNMTDLTFVLSLLKFMSASAPNSVDVKKSALLLGYVVDLLVNCVSNPEADNNHTFMVSNIIGEVIEALEIEIPTKSDTTNTKEYILDNISRIVSLVNQCAKDSTMFREVFNGISSAIQHSRYPSNILQIVCIKVASVDHMATWIEQCIERDYMISLTRSKFEFEDFVELDPRQELWTQAIKSIMVPELHGDEFTKFCIDNALIFTLYTHALQKMKEGDDLYSEKYTDHGVSNKSGNFELKVMIAEQIATWICGIKLDVVASSTSPETSDSRRGFGEEKILLLLGLFAEILRLEMQQYEQTPLRSRLRSYLGEIANVLLKWGEDRVSQGIWSTLGFGPKSPFRPTFRFASRSIGVFIVLRLLGQTSADAETEAERMKVIGTVEKSITAKDYEMVGGDKMRQVLEVIKNLDMSGVSNLSAIVELVRHLWYSDLEGMKI